MLTATPPAFSEAEAMAISAKFFGINARSLPLVSERDQNFLLDAECGRRYTLKISNRAEHESAIDFQNRALLHVAGTDASLPLPRVIPTLNGHLHCCVERKGETHIVRVLSWLDGMVLGDAAAAARLAFALGQFLARLGLALKDFDHPGSNPPLMWDMKRVEYLGDLLVHVREPGIRELIAGTLDRFVSTVKPVIDDLRAQVIHNDMNPGNVLMDKTQPGRISGLIDFGDLTRSPLVIDLAVAAAYQLSEGDDPFAGVLPMIAGYHGIRPLQDTEIALLRDLIQTRLITSILIGTYRATLFPENRGYLLISQDSVRNSLVQLARLDAGRVIERIHAACTLPERDGT